MFISGALFHSDKLICFVLREIDISYWDSFYRLMASLHLAVALCFRFRFQASEGFLTVDGFHPATLQFVVAAVEHFPRLRELIEISSQCILQELVGSAPALRREIVELLFNVGGEMYFHCLQSTGKLRWGQVMPRNNPHPTGVQSFEVTRAGLSQHDVSQWRAIMFDQIVGEKTARKPFAVAVSVSGQAAVLGLAILVPLLHTEAITAGRLTQFIPLKPWGTQHPTPQKPSTGRTPAKPGLRIFSERTLLQPPRIPQTVTMIDDGPSVASIPGSAAFSGTRDGVFGLVPTEVAPPPKPAPPQTPPQRTEAAPPSRVRIGGIVQAAKILRQVKPIYPPLARQARISGDVRLEAVISREGTVESLQVLSGHQLLIPAAIEAVRQWLYRPTLLNGDPVEVLTQIEVHFKLGE